MNSLRILKRAFAARMSLVASVALIGLACIGGLVACPSFNRGPGDDRAKYGGGYYHLSQGSELFPYSFYEVLERADSQELFKEHPERFGLIPDPVSKDNPLGLPVGLSVARHRGAPMEMIGMTCAACHSGMIEYGGKRLELRGAPGMFDPDAFFSDLANASEVMLRDPDKRFRFIKRYLARKAGLEALALDSFASREEMENAGEFERELLKDLDQLIAQELKLTNSYMDSSGAEARHDVLMGEKEDVPPAFAQPSYSKMVVNDTELERGRAKEPKLLRKGEKIYKRASKLALGECFDSLGADIRLFVASIRFLENYASVRSGATSLPGNGRVDAFGKVRNMVVPLMYGPEVIRATTAPVSFPRLWDTRRTKWLHWNGNTDSVMERNVLEAMGSGAIVDLDKFDTTVNFLNLYDLESMTHEITSPVWPKDILPPIDEAKADLGKTIFFGSQAEYQDVSMGNCVKCHAVPADAPPAGLNDFHQESLQNMGSDPNHAVNFNRLVDGGHGPFYANMKTLAEKVTTRYYTVNKIDAETQRKWEDDRGDVVWRSPIEAPLPSRPLTGVWATAPYLHNGSVPTLYDLLLPSDDRPSTFTTGSYRFDPVRVGYEGNAPDARFVFDVNAPVKDAAGKVYPEEPNGNSNRGHEFGTHLSDPERWALVEYLKTI